MEDDRGVEEEYDMLESMFPSEFDRHPDDPNRFSLRLLPRDSDAETARMRATLCVTLPKDYPESSPPTLSISESKGMSDAAVDAVLSAAREAADESIGMNSCFGVVDAALDALTEASEGGEVECCVCLDPISGKDGSFTPACVHSFHNRCFCRWVYNVECDVEAKKEEEETGGAVGRSLNAARGDVTSAVSRRDSGQAALVDLNAQLDTATAALTAVRADEEAEPAAVREAEALVDRIRRSIASTEKSIKSAEKQVTEASQRVQKLEAQLAADLALRVADTPCPVCRAVVPFADFKDMYAAWKRRRAKRSKAATSGSSRTTGAGSGAEASAGAGGGASPTAVVADTREASKPFLQALDPRTKSYLTRFRKRWKKVCARQKKAGGLVEEEETKAVAEGKTTEA